MMTMDARGIAPLTISDAKHYGGRFIAEHREIMWALQGKRCTVCGCPLKLSDAKSDHCHATGMPRGVLCHGCNTFEGAYWAALRRGEDGVAVIGRYEKGRTARPRGSLSYAQRALVLEKRYWPVWDLWAEQAGELLTQYGQQARGRRPDALLLTCGALVVMRWRGCPAFEPLLWATVKENGQYLLACGKAVTPDGGRAHRLVTETLARAYPKAWARSGARGTGSFSPAEQAA
jgi:hypothetical protein